MNTNEIRAKEIIESSADIEGFDELFQTSGTPLVVIPLVVRGIQYLRAKYFSR